MSMFMDEHSKIPDAPGNRRKGSRLVGHNQLWRVAALAAWLTTTTFAGSALAQAEPPIIAKLQSFFTSAVNHDDRVTEAQDQEGVSAPPVPMEAETSESALQKPQDVAQTEPKAAMPQPCGKVHHVFVEQPEEAGREEPARGLPARQPLPAGAFVAPPPSGAVHRQGAALGVTGLRIRFPALDLELPSIEFPAFTHRQRGAHMELEAAKAPYVAGAGQPSLGFPSMGVPMGVAQRPPSQPAAEEPAQQESARKEDLEKQLAELQSKCIRLEQLLEQRVQCQKDWVPAVPHGSSGWSAQQKDGK